MVKHPSGSSTPTIDAPAQTIGAKRKKIDEVSSDSTTAAAAAAVLRKKARNRASFSCGECHRRKQKCDRQMPCGHCVSRKVPHLCKAYTPGKSEQDVHLRLVRLERIIEKALPQYAFVDSNGSAEILPKSDDSDPGDQDEDEGNIGRLQSGTWHGVSAIGSISSAPILEQLRSTVPTPLTSSAEIRDSISHLARLSSCSKELALAAEHLNAARAGDTNSLMAATKIIDAVRQFADPNSGGLDPDGAAGLGLPTVVEDTLSAADKFRSLVQDCGVSPHKVSELLQDLPSKRQSDALVDFFFKTINFTRYPIDEREFRTAYEAVCQTHGIGINPNDIKFLPLLFVVLAIAVRLCPTSLAGDERQRRLTSLRYYWSSRRSVLFATSINNDSIELVWVRLLSARFLAFDRRITESWSQLGASVRTCQALGFHRDGTTMGLDRVQTQKRRRLWAYVYHADRSFALAMGRPGCINDDYTSSLPPWNIEDEELRANPDEVVDRPLSYVTSLTFSILRHQLAIIIGHICHHFQQVRRKTHYSEVLALEDELAQFAVSLPPHFAMHPDTSLDETHTYVPVHRFLLQSEIHFIRMSLHRPYILRRLDSDRYSRSRRACFDAAKDDFALRMDFQRKTPLETIKAMGLGYREFQTTMIAGIALMLDPTGSDAEDMKAILDAFPTTHTVDEEMDETTNRELQIIQFLRSKARDARYHAERSNPTSPLTPVTMEDSQTGANDSKNGSPQVRSKPPTSSMRLVPLPGMVNHPSHAGTVTSAAHFNPISAAANIQPIQTDETAESPEIISPSPGDEANGAQSLVDQWFFVSNAPQVDPLDPNVNINGWSNVSFIDSTVPGLDGHHGHIDGSASNLQADLDYWESMFNMLPSSATTTVRGGY